MKGLVVYHTKFGNCQKIAENITRGLKEAGLEVEITSSDARKIGSEVDFVAVGSGTRMGRMTGAIKRFIKREVKGDAWSGKPFLAFGTGGKPTGSDNRTDKWSAMGAQRIYDALEAKGLKPIGGAAKFYVLDMKGPLEEGEEERAHQLGLETGKLLLAPAV